MKRLIIAVSILIVIFIAVLFLVPFVAPDEKIPAAVTGQYELLYAENKAELNTFTLNETEFLAGDIKAGYLPVSDAEFNILLGEDAIKCRYDYEKNILELSHLTNRSYYVNSASFFAQNIILEAVYMSENGDILLYFCKDGMGGIINQSEEGRVVFSYTANEEYIKITGMDDSKSYEYFTYNIIDSGIILMSLTDNKEIKLYGERGDITPNEYILLSGDTPSIFSDFDSSKTAFYNNSLMIYDSDFTRLYGYRFDKNHLYIMDGDNKYDYMIADKAAADCKQVYGTYTVDDLSDILILNADKTGSLTIDGAGVDFTFTCDTDFIYLVTRDNHKLMFGYKLTDKNITLTVYPIIEDRVEEYTFTRIS